MGNEIMDSRYDLRNAVRKCLDVGDSRDDIEQEVADAIEDWEDELDG